MRNDLLVRKETVARLGRAMAQDVGLHPRGHDDEAESRDLVVPGEPLLVFRRGRIDRSLGGLRTITRWTDRSGPPLVHPVHDAGHHADEHEVAAILIRVREPRRAKGIVHQGHRM
ncbi:hypothetical protein [Pinisolibacter sp.]|uniref:hypothetical protein n=1 Tax=Pinisolibacter sp. TaxID=2172024 RepID=UPI002FDCDBBB